MSIEPDVLQLVVFRLGNAEYALPIASVREILRYELPRFVASPIPTVRGVIGQRGAIIPVYDIRELLGEESQITPETKTVIVDAGADRNGLTAWAGVIVDEVIEVLSVSTSSLTELPGRDSELVHDIAVVGERLVAVLDGARIAATTTTASARVLAAAA